MQTDNDFNSVGGNKQLHLDNFLILDTVKNNYDSLNKTLTVNSDYFYK